jgi:hypothetical protein
MKFSQELLMRRKFLNSDKLPDSIFIHLFTLFGSFNEFCKTDVIRINILIIPVGVLLIMLIS